MPGELYHVGASAKCPHTGTVSTISSNTRVMVSGMAVATVADSSTVAGCTFVVASKAQPCVEVQWSMPAMRVKVMGNFVLLRTSAGLCRSREQSPQGPANVVATQTRVKGT